MNILAIDLGGTLIKYGMFINDELVEKASTITEANKIDNKSLENLMDVIKIVTKKYTVDKIGIGVPGIVDMDKRNILKSANLFWENLDLVNIIEGEFNINTFLDNDANIATLAEKEFGVLNDYKDSILLTLGTGIGGSIVIDNKIFQSTNGVNFEVGHMVIDKNGPRCNCGRKGCFETLASATALVNYYNETSEENILGTKEIFDLYKIDDENAIKAVNWFINNLAIGINNLINLLDPEAIAFAGGLSKSFDLYKKQLEDKIEKEGYKSRKRYAKLLKSTLDDTAGILGAYLIAKEN